MKINLKVSLTRTFILALACSSAACSSIGTINGVRMGVTNSEEATYCEKNPTVCIVAGVAVVGGAIAIIASKNHKNVAPAAMAPPPQDM